MAMRLKSRTECPPGGFIVTLSQLPPKDRDRTFWSFAEAVGWFQGVARDNPRLNLPTDPAKIASIH